MRYVLGVTSALLAAAFLYFTFLSVAATSSPGARDQDTPGMSQGGDRPVESAAPILSPAGGRPSPD